MPAFRISLTNGKLGRKFYQFFNGKYYVDVIYNNYIIGYSMHLGYRISKILDRGRVELVGPYGLRNTLQRNSNSIAKIDTGNITNYALYIVLGRIVINFMLFITIFVAFGGQQINIDIISDNRKNLSFDFRVLIIVIIATVYKLPIKQ